MLSSYKFAICPEGNGVDTHRLWEALYFTCVPIVIKHHIYKDWDLPIIQVDKYEDIKEEMLYNFRQYNYMNDAMYMFYWKEIIQKAFEEL